MELSADGQEIGVVEFNVSAQISMRLSVGLVVELFDELFV